MALRDPFRLEGNLHDGLYGRMPTAAPILNPHMVDQWFAHSGPEEQEGDRRTAGLLRKNIAPRLAQLKVDAAHLSGQAAQRELHNLRGSVGSFGFSACVEHLTELEHHWAEFSEAQRLSALGTACDTFDAGLAELFKRFPHLRD
jgi:hypothetical protein